MWNIIPGHQRVDAAFEVGAAAVGAQAQLLQLALAAAQRLLAF
jgi:hypothetical protein